MKSKELLRRIDERDYLTAREHRDFLYELNKDLERLENIEKTLDKIANKIGLEYKDINELEYKVLQDLQKLEDYETIFKTPLKELREEKNILALLKKHLKVVKDWYNDDTMYRYILVLDFEDDEKEEMEVMNWVGECDED